MKRFIASCLLLFMLPALASADYWGWQCDGQKCRPILVRTTPRIVVAATPASYATFAPEPVVSLATFAPEPLPVVTSSTCNCAQTGICTCPAVACACPGCPANQVYNLGFSYAPRAYSLGAAQYGIADERIIYTPTGHVHVFADGSTMHSGGHLQRVVAKQERWRARKGIQ